MGASLARQVREMGKRGESAYQVDGEVSHDIPAQACRGRTGVYGMTFSGMINLSDGTLRFDCAEDPTFYLKIDLGKVPHFAAAPGGHVARSAAMEFECAGERARGSDGGGERKRGSGGGGGRKRAPAGEFELAGGSGGGGGRKHARPARPARGVTEKL